MIINGIQQIGVGVPDVQAGFKWFNKNFGTDIKVFEDPGVADLMKRYTGGEAHSRCAILALNLQGGGGMEIWQYTSRTPQPMNGELHWGDFGITCGKIKVRDIQKVYAAQKKNGLIVSEIFNRAGKKSFYTKDPWGNLWQAIEFDEWFQNNGQPSGGVAGAVIGVSDIEKAKEVYSGILGYTETVLDESGVIEDYQNLPKGAEKYRRVVLRTPKKEVAAFGPLLGHGEIELVQALDGGRKKLYEGRYWGDLGFIHLCFDVTGMVELRDKCEAAGRPFTVDSTNNFDMGEAAGFFSYIEDPDGTLIEFVETRKVPVIKALGINISLNPEKPKPLPNWMIKAMSMRRVKV